MEAEVEDVVDLLVGNVCKNYEEPGPRGSAANFLLSKEMEGGSQGREEAEGDALMAAFYNSNAWQGGGGGRCIDGGFV